jgi:ubiquinone/menaquinone biosynthesis C-methylase UbiE
LGKVVAHHRRGAQHVNDRLVDLAEIAPGKRVLDIATGSGERALSAAIRVGWIFPTTALTPFFVVGE